MTRETCITLWCETSFILHINCVLNQFLKLYMSQEFQHLLFSAQKVGAVETSPDPIEGF